MIDDCIKTLNNTQNHTQIHSFLQYLGCMQIHRCTHRSSMFWNRIVHAGISIRYVCTWGDYSSCAVALWPFVAQGATCSNTPLSLETQFFEMSGHFYDYSAIFSLWRRASTKAFAPFSRSSTKYRYYKLHFNLLRPLQRQPG